MKNSAPRIIVHKGESVFSIPASELFNLVCAKAKRNAGMKIPIRPDRNNFDGSPGFNSFSRGNASGKRKIDAAVTRNAPNTSGENALSPCLIKINEVPQIMESRIRRITGSTPGFFFTRSSYQTLIRRRSKSFTFLNC